MSDDFLINNGTGLKDSDIHECVAFWSEDDKRSKDEQLERWLARMSVPPFIVETGKSLHIYVVLIQPIAPGVWKPHQRDADIYSGLNAKWLDILR